MKKWTSLIIALAVLTLLSYYLMGLVVESTLNKNVNSIPKTTFLTIKLDKYHRGWFSSHAVLIIKMHIPPQTIKDKNGVAQTDQPVDFDLSFPLIINHGPFICTDTGVRFGMGQVTTQPPTHYGVLIDYFNHTVFKYTLPSFAINGTAGTSEGNFQLAWQGLKSQLSITPNIDKVNGNLVVYGLNGTFNTDGFTIGRVSNDFKLTRDHDGLWLGRTHFAIPSVEATMANKKIFDLKDFDWVFSSNVTGGSLNFNFDMSLKKLFADNKNYGPGAIKLRFKNLDPKAMADINQQELNMIQSNGDPSLALLAMLAEFPKLLNKGAELDLTEMTFNLPEGMIVGNLKIKLPQSTSSDPNQLFQKAHGEGQFKAPMSIVKKLLVASIKQDLTKQAQNATQEQSTTQVRESIPATTLPTAPVSSNQDDEAQQQADKTLQDWISKGIIKVEGNDYIVLFKLDNGQVMVNGKPFNPGMLQ